MRRVIPCHRICSKIDLSPDRSSSGIGIGIMHRIWPHPLDHAIKCQRAHKKFEDIQ